ncbi:MAG: hypothetical protein EBY89_07630, partial [Actinobacteria bacterium]|nr:hypothetical protein [Actinomycetota bacterium]
RIVSLVIDNGTIRAGRLLAPLSVRYVVVPIVDGGVSTSDSPLAPPVGLLDGLAQQLDLRRTYTASDLVIFENTAWIPTLAVLDESSALASQQAGDSALVSARLRALTALPLIGDIASERRAIDPSTVHLAVPYDDGLTLRVGASDVKSRVAFGGTTAFDSPVAGIAEINYDTSLGYQLQIFLQIVLWVALVVVSCGVALGAATLASFVFDDESSTTYRWWKPLVALAVVGVVAGSIPTVVATVDGRWGQPKTTMSQLLAQLPTNPPEGDFVTLYVARPEVLPLRGERLSSDVAFGVARDGELTLRDQFVSTRSTLDDAVGRIVSLVIDNGTIRAGRLLAPLSVRYVVVPIVDG